ncbi:MAG: hypothetical protein K0U40_05845 [Betaproteobacteria bacterium]|nr:hypothetical protein [Betaproteobacteria bacterium]
MTLKKSIKEFGTLLGENESLLDRDFKRIAEKIELHWGYEEFYPFMNKLFVNDFDRDRAGFSPAVMQELYDLTEIHDQLFPGIKGSKKVFDR